MTAHVYETQVCWSADGGEGTRSYRSYSRNHTVGAAAKPPIGASSDPAFRGDASRYNPEELFVASLSACHMLWYLHLCATSGVTVVEYRDGARGTLELDRDGSGRFASIVLRPAVLVTAESDPARAAALHERAHECCFLARSVTVPIAVVPDVRRQPD